MFFKYIFRLLLASVLTVLVNSEAVKAKKQSQPTDKNLVSMIPYKYLSNEDIDPYFQHGKLVKFSNFPNQIKAAERIQDVRDCLVEGERTKEQPDLTKINWPNLRNEEVNVCLFRVASSIGEIGGIVDWLVTQGFDRDRIRVDKELSSYNKTGRYIKASAGRKDGQPVIIYRNWLIDWIAPTIYSESVSILVSPETKILDVNVVGSSK